MATILSKDADDLLHTLHAAGNQVEIGLIFPEGTYDRTLQELRKKFTDDQIYEALKTVREGENHVGIIGDRTKI